MMTDYWYTLGVLIGSAGMAVVIVHRARSLSNEDVDAAIREWRVAQWVRRIREQTVDKFSDFEWLERAIVSAAEKWLRRVNVVLLRLENWVARRLDAVRTMKQKNDLNGELWESLQGGLLEKQLEQTWHRFRAKVAHAPFDPVQEEQYLRDHAVDDCERWLNLTRFYLAQDRMSEAVRTITDYWRMNQEDQRVYVLMQDMARKLEEEKAKTSEQEASPSVEHRQSSVDYPREA
jgi:hypothetical protein